MTDRIGHIRAPIVDKDGRALESFYRWLYRNVLTTDGVQTLTNKTFTLGGNTFSGTLAQFNTACTNADFASLDGTETLTNKTVNLTSNTLVGTTAQFNTALSDGDFATLAGTETLTNKTIIVGIVTETGTTRTCVLTDASKWIETSNGSAVTITIPPFVDVAYASGTVMNFFQAGAGQITLAPGTGVTLNGTPGLKTRAQYSAIGAIHSATQNTWRVFGDLAA